MSDLTYVEALDHLHESYKLNAELLAQLAECRAVLKEVQWNGPGDAAECPECDREPIQGHAPDCRLAKCLSEK